MSAKRPPSPPVNWLANADNAGDIMYASRHVILFLKAVHQMKQRDGELGREESQEGLAMILAMVADALAYGEQLAESADQVQSTALRSA